MLVLKCILILNPPSLVDHPGDDGESDNDPMDGGELYTVGGLPYPRVGV